MDAGSHHGVGGGHLTIPNHTLKGFAEVDSAAARLSLQASQGIGTPLGCVAGSQSQAATVFDGEGVAGLGGLPGFAQYVVEKG